MPAILDYAGRDIVKRKADDVSQLKALAITHYILGGLLLVWAITVLFTHHPVRPDHTIVAIVAIAVFGAALWCSGFCMQRRIFRPLSIMVAAFSAMIIPVGSILALFTVRVLERPTVKRLYISAPNQ